MSQERGIQGQIGDVTVHYVENGRGVPLVALHGAGVDHREIEAAAEAVIPSTGYRRIYPDLPGMGRTTADGLADARGRLSGLDSRTSGARPHLRGVNQLRRRVRQATGAGRAAVRVTRRSPCRRCGC
jgi:pimeloyl-ACP methyl ester carboxylesterase